MKISVLIPAYNASQTIRYAVESILKQTVQPFEILAVDDGSTDATASILKMYSGVTVLTQSNSGVGVTRNKLCAVARGDILTFLDADDIMHPHYLATLTQIIERTPQAFAWFVGHVDFRGSFEWPKESGSATDQILNGDTFFRKLCHEPGDFSCGSCFSVSRKACLDLGSQPFGTEKRCEDLYCHLRLSRRGVVVYNPTPLIAYRVGTDSLSSDSLAISAARVRVFQAVAPEFHGREFIRALAGAYRSHAKFLFGANRMTEGRKELINAIRLRCELKSFGLFCKSLFPAKWPPTYRG